MNFVKWKRALSIFCVVSMVIAAAPKAEAYSLWVGTNTGKAPERDEPFRQVVKRWKGPWQVAGCKDTATAFAAYMCYYYQPESLLEIEKAGYIELSDRARKKINEFKRNPQAWAAARQIMANVFTRPPPFNLGDRSLDDYDKNIPENYAIMFESGNKIVWKGKNPDFDKNHYVADYGSVILPGVAMLTYWDMLGLLKGEARGKGEARDYQRNVNPGYAAKQMLDDATSHKYIYGPLEKSGQLTGLQIARARDLISDYWDAKHNGNTAYAKELRSRRGEMTTFIGNASYVVDLNIN